MHFVSVYVLSAILNKENGHVQFPGCLFFFMDVVCGTASFPQYLFSLSSSL